MDDLFNSIQRIKDYYKEVDQRIIEEKGKNIFSVEGEKTNGVYAPNSIDVFVDIITRGIMEHENSRSTTSLENLSILDAGCGDSRSLAVASIFNMNAYGLDLDDYLVKISLCSRGK